MALAQPGNSEAIARRILESHAADEPNFPAMALDDTRDDGEVRRQVWLVSETVGLPELYQRILSFVLPADDVLSIVLNHTCHPQGTPVEMNEDDVKREFGMELCWSISLIRDRSLFPLSRELDITFATKNGRIGVERLRKFATCFGLIGLLRLSSLTRAEHFLEQMKYC